MLPIGHLCGLGSIGGRLGGCVGQIPQEHMGGGTGLFEFVSAALWVS